MTGDGSLRGENERFGRIQTKMIDVHSTVALITNSLDISVHTVDLKISMVRAQLKKRKKREKRPREGQREKK